MKRFAEHVHAMTHVRIRTKNDFEPFLKQSLCLQIRLSNPFFRAKRAIRGCAIRMYSAAKGSSCGSNLNKACVRCSRNVASKSNNARLIALPPSSSLDSIRLAGFARVLPAFNTPLHCVKMGDDVIDIARVSMQTEWKAPHRVRYVYCWAFICMRRIDGIAGW